MVTSYTVRLAGCDESKHPHCAGVVTPAAVEKAGFTDRADAEGYGREAIQDPWTAGDVAGDGGRLLPGGSAGVTLRDYVVLDGDGQLVSKGEHDDYDVFN